MGMPLQITFRGMEPSPTVETRVQEMVQRLDRHQDRITSCRVVIEAPHRRHHKGKLYTVAIDVTYPGGEVVANRGKRFDHAHEDVYVAIRDAFNAVRRKLKDDTRIRRGNTKAHADPFLGTVVKLLPDHGFAETAQGEVYFHREAVAGGGFEVLAVGARVRLVLAENESEHGSQASTVIRWNHEAP